MGTQTYPFGGGVAVFEGRREGVLGGEPVPDKDDRELEVDTNTTKMVVIIIDGACEEA